MTLLRFEGFDDGDLLDARYWAGSNGRINPGRAGGQAFQASASTDRFDTVGIVTTSPTVTVGGALNLRAHSIVSTAHGFFRLYTSAGLQLQLRFFDTHTELVRGDSTVIATGERIGLLQWRFVEVQATFDATLGSVTVRADGKEIIAYSGNTLAVGTSTFLTRVECFNHLGGYYLDDFYLLDNLGTDNITFLGDVKVARLLPNGNGATNVWVGSDADSVDNYLLVNETPANFTTYVQSSTLAQRDLYALGDLTAADVNSVLAVKPVAIVGKDDAGAASFRHLIRSSAGTVVSSDPVSAAQSQTTYDGPIYTLAPAGGAWTATEVNGLQAGVEAA